MSEKVLLLKLRAQLLASLAEINKALNEEEKITFQKTYEKFLSENQHRTHDYIRKFKATVDYFLEACGNLPIDDIDKAVISKFIAFVNKINSSITVHDHVKRLRLILKVEIDSSFVRYSHGYKPQRISLTENELALIENYKPESEALERVQDFFLFGCYTGFRFADLCKLTKVNIIKVDDKLALKDTQNKTFDEVFVPLSTKALRIIEKYKDLPTLLPQITNQRTNEHLKKIALEAGVNEKVQKVSYINNVRKEVTVPKWKLVSCHIARHTFATLLEKKQVDLLVISKALGHKNVATTNIYLHTDRTRIMEDVLNALE